MKTLQIATTRDIPQIQRLLQQTWQDTYRGYLSQHTLSEVYKNWQNVEFLTKQIENKDIYFPVMNGNGKVAGIATALLRDSVIKLFRLSVYPQHQRKGNGERLLNAVQDNFSFAKKIELHVEVFNEIGKAFYHKHGFKEVKRDQEKIGSEIIDQILMEKNL